MMLYPQSFSVLLWNKPPGNSMRTRKD